MELNADTGTFPIAATPETILDNTPTLAIGCPIQRMPAEILLEIFRHLSPVHNSRDGDIWNSLQDPDPESFLGDVLPVFTFSASKPHLEHPIVLVCRQWRALLKTTLATSKIVVNYRAKADRISSWLRNTGTTPLVCEFKCTGWAEVHRTQQAMFEKTRVLLDHIPRITVLSLEQTRMMLMPILSGSAAYAVPNLVSLTLNTPLRDSASDLEDVEPALIACVEIPKLKFLNLSGELTPLYLRLFAPRLETLQLRTYSFKPTEFTALGACFPALSVLYMDSDILEEEEEFTMPFPRLNTWHISIHESEQYSVPLLKNCHDLGLISFHYPSHEIYESFVLPRNFATHFVLEKSGDRSLLHQPWLTHESLDSLPNLRHILLRDLPKQSWYSHETLRAEAYQEDNERIITLLDKGVCPLLESITFKDFGIRTRALSDLMEKRPSLKITWSRLDTVIELTSTSQDDSLERLKQFDNPQTFYSPWITFD